MSHPLHEGDYLIMIHDNSDEVRHVAGLENDEFVMVIPQNILAPFAYKLWRLQVSGSGYTFYNIGSERYANPRDLKENSPVYLTVTRQAPTIFNIQPDGEDCWRVTVPEHNLDWTEADFVRDGRQGYIKLSGSMGSDKQRFVFQRFFGP